jgi:putative hemolysin
LDDGSSGVAVLIALLIVLLFASGGFSATETALFSLNRVQRRRFKEEGSIRAQLIANVLQRPRRILSTILFGNTLVNVATASVATVLFERMLSDNAVAIAIAIDTAAVLLFGEIVPKTIAANGPVQISRLAIMPLHLFARLSTPFVVVFDRIARWLLKLLGVPDEAGGALSPSELSMLFEEAGRRKAISAHETEMARNIIEFSETTSDEIMTPRVEVVSAPIDSTPEALRTEMITSHHSRIPIYEGDIDNIVGFLSAKEFLLNADREVRELLKPVAIFPEGAKIHRIFRHMQKQRINMAVIVNEYGETAGILTMEDLVEEIVGEIYDEYEKAEQLIRKTGPDTWVARARASLSDVNEVCGLALPDHEAVTLNGYLCDEFGEIPEPGRVLEQDGARFTVIESLRRRIVSCRIERLPVVPVPDPGART